MAKTKKCSCGGLHYKEKNGHQIDTDNVLKLTNPWAKVPTKEDLKICKSCWFEARNGHAPTCEKACDKI